MRSAIRSLSGLTAQGDVELPRITAPEVSNDAVIKLQGVRGLPSVTATGGESHATRLCSP